MSAAAFILKVSAQHLPTAKDATVVTKSQTVEKLIIQ